MTTEERLAKVDPDGRLHVKGFCSKWCIKCSAPHAAGYIEEMAERSRKRGREPDYPNCGILCAPCLLDALMGIVEEPEQ